MNSEGNGTVSWLGDISTPLGDVLLAWRNYRGLTQEELGEKSGLAKAYISQIETNKVKRPGDKKLEQLADALNIKTINLILRHMPPATPQRATQNEYRKRQERANIAAQASTTAQQSPSISQVALVHAAPRLPFTTASDQGTPHREGWFVENSIQLSGKLRTHGKDIAAHLKAALRLMGEHVEEPDLEATIANLPVRLTTELPFSAVSPSPNGTNGTNGGNYGSAVLPRISLGYANRSGSYNPLLHTLPEVHYELVGRAKEYSHLLKLVTEGSKRLVTITGSPGIGKTHLAIAAARSYLAGSQEREVGFVSLARVTKRVDVGRAIAEQLGVDTDPCVLLRYIQDRDHNKHLLLLLDHVEDAEGIYDEIVALLAVAPTLRILATSVAPLSFTAGTPLHMCVEEQFPLRPLEVPDLSLTTDYEALRDNQAVRLFGVRAKYADPSYAINEDNSRWVAAVCSQLDGYPLSIQLAAGQMSGSDAGELLTRLPRVRHEEIILPPEQSKRVEARNDMIAWSVSHLPPNEKGLLRRLVVFASDFSDDAVQPLVTEFGNKEEISSALQALVDKGLLLELGDPPTNPRYKLLERVRKYALGSLVKPKELKNAQRRHASHYLALAEEADSHLWGPGEAEAVRWFEREHQNLRVALRWLIDNRDTENALRLVGALCLFWEILGSFHEGRKWFNEVLEQARTGNVDERVLAKALSGGGMLAHGQGDHEEATRLIDEAIALRRKLRDQYELCLSLNDMALVKLFTIDFDAANALAMESLELGRSYNYRGVVAAALRRLALVERERGYIDSARGHFTESLEIYRQLGDVWRTAIALDNLAGLELDASNVTAAEPLLRESKDLKETIGDLRGLAFAHKNLARLRLYQGDYKAALQHAATSSSIWIRIGDNWREAETLVIMGWAHCYLAEYLRANNSFDAELEYKTAKELFTSSLSNMRTPEKQRNVAEGIEGLARVFAQCGEPELAAILCGAASQLRNQILVPGSAWQVSELHRTESYIRDQLDATSWTIALARGQSMPLDAVLELALLADQQPARA